MDIESQPGRGTTMIIRLPETSAAEPDSERAAEVEAAPASEEDSSASKAAALQEKES